MRKILFFILMSMSITCFGQDSLNVDSKQVNEGDSIHAASTTTTMFSNNTLDNVTKTEGDSAYIKDTMV